MLKVEADCYIIPTNKKYGSTGTFFMVTWSCTFIHSMITDQNGNSKFNFIQNTDCQIRMSVNHFKAAEYHNFQCTRMMIQNTDFGRSVANI
jgi:hypothetical protein